MLDPALACRLAKACEAAYFIDKPGGLQACPSYGGVGFADQPDVAVGGPGGIDAGLVGTSVDGIILAFRGTLPPDLPKDLSEFLKILDDWINDARVPLVPGYGGKVHKGFAGSIENLWAELEPKVRERAAAGKPILVTGHSKGGAMAMLAAVRLADAGLSPAAVVTYAAPRVGNGEFAGHYQATIAEHWRFENRDDIVPHLPPASAVLPMLVQLDPRFKRLVEWEYESVGTLRFIDWKGNIVDPSSKLKLQRMVSLVEKLAAQRFGEIVEDHFLTKYYTNAVCG